MALRSTNIDRLDDEDFDVLIIGGGINGAVSAAALAARGARVALVDRGDFAGFTSQESSNLVWGGFKYLENYELLLVRKLCTSRNRLIKAYPANVEAHRLPRRARQVGAVSPLAGSAGFDCVLGDRQLQDEAAGVSQPEEDRGTRAGDRHHATFGVASSTTTPT